MKVSVVDICVEAIIYLLLYNLHDCTFKSKFLFLLQDKEEKEGGTHFVLLSRSRNMTGRFMKTYLHQPIKILQFLSDVFFFFFFYQGFFSRTLATHRTAGEGRGPSFIPLYYFHPLTNIQTFICNFVCEMTITYF